MKKDKLKLNEDQIALKRLFAGMNLENAHGGVSDAQTFEKNFL